MRNLRMTFLTIVAAIAGVLVPTAALAQPPYPVVLPDLTVDTAIVPSGATVTISGSGFLPFEQIKILITFRVRPPGPVPALPELQRAELPAQTDTVTTQADATGSFTATVPVDGVGTATIIARGVESGHAIYATVLAVRAESGAESGLPVTGSNGGLLVRQVVLAGVALVAGAGLVLLSVLRRRAAG